MPIMPAGNPWTDITTLFGVEDAIRRGGAPIVSRSLPRLDNLAPYWADIGRLFAIYALTKGYDGSEPERLKQVADLRRAMSSDFYASYIRKRAKKAVRDAERLDLEILAQRGGT
jgi:thymidylate synthase